MKKESRGASRGKKTEYDALPYDFDTEEYYEEEEVADELFEE